MDVGTFLRDNVFFWCQERPKAAITYCWITIIGLTLLIFITSCAVASGSDDNSGHTAISFIGIWTSLTLMVMVIGGTITLRKHHNQLAVGCFMGSCFVIVNQLLMMFSIFAEHSSENNHEDDSQAEQATATFAWLLFMALAVFDGLLVAFQNDLIKDTHRADMTDGDEGYEESVGGPSGLDHNRI